ncbi:MAG: hypothetical protein ABJO01_09925 [Parasphingorhabdus sp.]|uniref:hypothetical protein n=1 Tax=Parasphingorhabdus sp. TaxID=2709688 RepID=UPI0032969D85
MSEMHQNKMQLKLQQLSPAMRKFLALATLLFVSLFIWNVIITPVAAQMEASLSKLQDARYQRMRLEQLAAQPAPPRSDPLPAELLAVAATPQQASAQISSYLNGLAAQNDLQVANITSHSGLKGAKLLAFDFALIGEELALVRFINALERGAPMIRLRSWQIDGPDMAGGGTPEDLTVPDPAISIQQDSFTDRTMRFSGQAVAAWTKP